MFWLSYTFSKSVSGILVVHGSKAFAFVVVLHSLKKSTFGQSMVVFYISSVWNCGLIFANHKRHTKTGENKMTRKWKAFTEVLSWSCSEMQKETEISLWLQAFHVLTNYTVFAPFIIAHLNCTFASDKIASGLRSFKTLFIIWKFSKIIQLPKQTVFWQFVCSDCICW